MKRSPYAMLAGVAMSACERYRYRLLREFEGGSGTVCFLMLNPSTADATYDDPTIRRCNDFAQRWGYHTLAVANLFALRATNPRELSMVDDPIGEGNDAAIHSLCDVSERIVCAWGSHPAAKTRAFHVVSALERHFAVGRVFALEINRDGSPKHPLYVAAAKEPQVWRPR